MEWKDLETFDFDSLESDKVHDIDGFLIHKNSQNDAISISKKDDK